MIDFIKEIIIEFYSYNFNYNKRLLINDKEIIKEGNIFFNNYFNSLYNSILFNHDNKLRNLCIKYNHNYNCLLINLYDIVIDIFNNMKQIYCKIFLHNYKHYIDSITICIDNYLENKDYLSVFNHKCNNLKEIPDISNG